MKPRQLSVLLVVFLIVSMLTYHSSYVSVQAETSMDFFLGIDIAYENMTTVKQLVDETCNYTNLFIIGCSGITYNSTLLDDICNYVNDRGLSFIVYRESAPRSADWILGARERWGDRFLGFYVFDEVGGKQLDQYENWTSVAKANNYSDASSQFVKQISGALTRFSRFYSNVTDVPLFQSDYALYWWDYKAGYDTLLAQFGWNYSRQLNIALLRGAATVQNKDWGVIVSWEYTLPPYIESGPELYNDLVLAYQNGAKYIVVFDSNEEYTDGILQKEHLDAITEFWQYAKNNPRSGSPASDRVAYVLPKDYGYGFRGPTDKIWGLWEADNIEIEICSTLDVVMKKYGTKLDIICDDGLQPGNMYGYSKLIYWNETDTSPSLTPSQLSSFSPSLSPTQQPITDFSLSIFIAAVVAVVFSLIGMMMVFHKKKK
jgi:hypothetical protein